MKKPHKKGWMYRFKRVAFKDWSQDKRNFHQQISGECKKLSALVELGAWKEYLIFNLMNILFNEFIKSIPFI